MKDDAYIDDTVKVGTVSLENGSCIPHASELDNIYFSTFSLLDIGLIESNVTTVICAREDKKAPSNIIDLITLFMRKAAAGALQHTLYHFRVLRRMVLT